MEFCPRDFEAHMEHFKKSLIDIISERATNQATEIFGTGDLKIDRFEQISISESGFPIWCLDGYWHFNSIDFTEQQREMHKKYFTDHTAVPYEQIAESETV